MLLLYLFSVVTLASRYTIIYSYDQGYYPVGNCDGDNPQALMHLLFYANDIDLSMIIASGSTNCAPPGSNIAEAMDIVQ